MPERESAASDPNRDPRYDPARAPSPYEERSAATASPERCDECRSFQEDCRCGEYDDRDEYDCTICGGDGTCMDNSDPLWDCDDLPHACHSCGGTGRRSAQRYM